MPDQKREQRTNRDATSCFRALFHTTRTVVISRCNFREGGVSVYAIRHSMPVIRERERSAFAIRMRSRRAAREEQIARWAAEESGRAGREPRPSSFGARRNGGSGKVELCADVS